MQIFSLFFAAVITAMPVMAMELPDPGTLPGSFWYPFKIWTEEVGDWFTFGEVRTMDRLLDRTSLRLAEARVIAGTDDVDSLASAEQAYQDTWQEFWSSLQEMEEPVPLTEKSIRLLMDHRQNIGSMRINLNKTWMSVLNYEVRGIKILLDEHAPEGEKILTDVLIDRVRMIPQTGFDDIIALDPLVGLLRTQGEKKVIALMIGILPVFDDLPISQDHDRAQQHVFQTIRGDLTRYVLESPDDAVLYVRDLLEWGLYRVEQSVQDADDVRILKDLGKLSIVLGITEEVSQGLLLPSAYAAAQSLHTILTTISSRLRELPLTGHEAMVHDQRMRTEGISRILEGSQVREDLARTIPPDLLKMFPDLPWTIPAMRPGVVHVPLNDKDRTNKSLGNDAFEFKQPSSLSNLEEVLKSRLAPMLPVTPRPTPKMGEDPSVRFQELLQEKSGTFAPLPIDLKTQVPTVR